MLLPHHRGILQVFSVHRTNKKRIMLWLFLFTLVTLTRMNSLCFLDFPQRSTLMMIKNYVLERKGQLYVSKTVFVPIAGFYIESSVCDERPLLT